MTTNDIPVLIEALQQQNLVYNYNFLYFSNQSLTSTPINYNHPDGWLYKDTGSSGTIGLSEDACRITTASQEGETMTFQQALHEFPRWKNKLLGQTVTAKAHISLNKGTAVSVSIDDGIGSNSQIITAQEDGDYVFDAQLTINANAKKLYLTIATSSANAVLSIHKVYANIGLIALETLPCIVNGIIGSRNQYIATEHAPAEELSICEAAQELNADQTRLDSVLNNRFGTGDNKRSLLPDVRGYFSRAWNNKAATDPDASKREMLGNNSEKGDLVGTGEDDIFEKHQHDLKYATTSITLGPTTTPFQGLNPALTSKTEEIGGAETRPINVAELYTIKWA